MKGIRRPHSDISKKRISTTLSNRTLTEAHKANISKARKAYEQKKKQDNYGMAL